jgi:hypothetical protein
MEPTTKPNANPAADEREKSRADALAAAQQELMKHSWDTFVNNPPSFAQGGKGTVVPGCVHCKKIIYSDSQYLSHLALDVLPQILDRMLRAHLNGDLR